MLLSKVTRTWDGACSRIWRSPHEAHPSRAPGRRGDSPGPCSCSSGCGLQQDLSQVPNPGAGSAQRRNADQRGDIDGDGVRLVETPGHVVVLDFWGSWCGPCRAEQPALNTLDDAVDAEGRDLPRRRCPRRQRRRRRVRAGPTMSSIRASTTPSEVIVSEYNVIAPADGGRHRRARATSSTGSSAPLAGVGGDLTQLTS